MAHPSIGLYSRFAVDEMRGPGLVPSKAWQEDRADDEE
jgi:hypothetical protein